MNDLSEHKLENLKGRHADAFADIPANYFGELPEKVTAKIHQQKKVPLRRTSRFVKTGIAAIILLLIGLSVFLLLQTRSDNHNPQIAENNTVVTHQDSLTESEMEENDDTTLISEVIGNPGEPSANHEVEPDDPFAELDEIPLEALLEYVNELDEFEF